jgi:hypothetical protein
MVEDTIQSDSRGLSNERVVLNTWKIREERQAFTNTFFQIPFLK